MALMVIGKLTCISGHSQNFLHIKLSPSEKPIFSFFDNILNFLNFLENYPAISEVLGSVQRTGCGKLIFYAPTPRFSDTKGNGPRKSLS